MSADSRFLGHIDASPASHIVDAQSSIGSSASNGVSAMTIEFLRARLLSERAASKSARQQVQQLSLKVSELQARLDAEVEQRKQTQDSMERMLKYLRAKGLPVECLEKSEAEFENLESIKEVDDHGTASERSVTKHEVMNSPRCHQCNQTLLASNVQPSSIDHGRVPNPSPEECYTEEPHRGSPGDKDRRRHPSDAEEICPNDKNTRNGTEICGRDEKLQPAEIPDRLESAAFKLKSMLHQIVQEINTLPRDQSLKVQLKDWADNVIQLCDDNTLHGLESEGERCDSSHREKGMDCSKAGESLLCSSMNEKHETAVDDTKEDVQNSESRRATQQRHPNDLQHDAVGGSVSEQSMLHDKSSEYMRGKLPYTVGTQYSGKPHDGVVTGRHSYQDSKCRDWHEIWPPSKPDAGHEAMPCDFYRKQDVVYRNLETDHGYVCDVWHRDRVISTRNAKEGHHHHQSLMDEKNGRLGDILNALQEARQYVDDAGRSEGPYVGGGFCPPQVLLPHAEEDFCRRVNHERRNSAQPQPPSPPIIHLPSSSPISDRGAPTLLDRHDGILLMRSRSVSSSFANFSHVDHHRKSLRPAREVQLGNGITLYTD